ncbi:MAG TPA: prolyl oligopeptidase family serine peptidase [Burkholderiaceae bacterium]|nr:prolyl oligopeptidase family serine peptidase [Burkholderiaceae bacterium]
MTRVPPVPASLPARIGPYTEFKGAGLLDWSPDGRQLLVTYLHNNRTQLHQVSGPAQPLKAITSSPEPTRAGAYLPGDPGVVVFERDVGGSETSRVFRLDLATGAETALTDEKLRCDMGPFDANGGAVLVHCSRVDRNTGGNVERAGGVTVDLALIDVKSGRTRAAATMNGAGWFPLDLAPDDRTVLLLRYRSASDSEIWTLDLASGASRRLLPHEGEPAASYFGVGFAPDGKRIFVATDRFGEFTQLYRYDPEQKRFDAITMDIPWDVTRVSLLRDRSRLAAVTNENGRGVPRAYDAATLQPIPVPPQPGINVTSVQLSPDGSKLAYSGSSAAAPSEVTIIDLRSKQAALWAAADRAGVDTSAFQPKEVIRWKTFDGRTITGLIQRPPKTFTGRRPVLIEIHGGPEAQAQVNFSGRYNYIINEMGIALIEPNVRGSTGFGKSFQKLDDGKLREDSVRDIGALLDWIATQPDLDPSRVVVQGGSYGGYMANAVATKYSDRIRGAMTAVGISNFVSFLERTESYRRDLRRSEYGDERDPAMREFLLSISPLTNADKINAPLFVIHGRNDPRVPVQEAEQIAATVERNGVPVWVMIAENEGHGFAKKENADYLFYARVLFLERFLLAP